MLYLITVFLQNLLNSFDVTENKDSINYKVLFAVNLQLRSQKLDRILRNISSYK